MTDRGGGGKLMWKGKLNELAFQVACYLGKVV